jgi:hypothetical protein
MKLSESEIKELQIAKNLLENPGIAARITSFIGTPLEKGIELLPENWTKNIGEITNTALMKAANTAIFTMNDTPSKQSSNVWHKIGVAASGGIGGFFGIAALTLELPISTTIMLRSIADIARSEGESVNDVETKMACLEVFALGGESKEDDSAESGYFVIRAALAREVAAAAEFIAEKGLIEESAPLLVKVISSISERYKLQITEKFAGQCIPYLGAIGGATINTLFMDHFQDMARGHFIVRKLERFHGKDNVKSQYDLLPKFA